MNTAIKTNKMSLPGGLLRLEGLGVLGTAVFLYSQAGFSWLTFVLLLLWPDIAIVAYAINLKTGSMVYNLIHTYFFPLLLAGVAITADFPLGYQFALIWLAHIGMDRMVGYGLKYPTDFKDTHLNRV